MKRVIGTVVSLDRALEQLQGKFLLAARGEDSGIPVSIFRIRIGEENRHGLSSKTVDFLWRSLIEARTVELLERSDAGDDLVTLASLREIASTLIVQREIGRDPL